MTSAQTMLNRMRCMRQHQQPPIVWHPPRPLMMMALWIITITIASLGLAGCGQRLQQPMPLVSPAATEQLWAVVPLANESGVSFVDTARLADMFARELQHVQGINAIPVNRVLRTMRELDLRGIETAGDARQLLQALQADALVIGSVTAYDPYPPITLGMAVELYAAERVARMNALDTIELTRSPTDYVLTGMYSSDVPVAQAAGVFAASSHETLAQLDQYARGRHVPDSAFGEEIYLVSMDLYTQFVSHQLIAELLIREHIRINSVMSGATTQEPR